MTSWTTKCCPTHISFLPPAHPLWCQAHNWHWGPSKHNQASISNLVGEIRDGCCGCCFLGEVLQAKGVGVLPPICRWMKHVDPAGEGWVVGAKPGEHVPSQGNMHQAWGFSIWGDGVLHSGRWGGHSWRWGIQ